MVYVNNIIQLMHSFEVNIRICQPGKVMSTEANQDLSTRESDVHRGEAEMDITFEG